MEKHDRTTLGCEQEHESALHRLVADAYTLCTGDKNTQHRNDAADNGSQFLKTASLFIPKRGALIAAASVFAADEVDLKHPDKAALDIAFGASKGMLLRGTNDWAILTEAHPLVQGAILGATSRVADVAFTRSTYQLNDNSQLSLALGSQRLYEELTNRSALVGDIASCAAARVLMHGLPADSSPRLAAAISGSTMGMMSGAVEEIKKEQAVDRKLDLGNIAIGSFTAGIRDGAAAAFGASLGGPRLHLVGATPCVAREPEQGQGDAWRRPYGSSEQSRGAGQGDAWRRPYGSSEQGEGDAWRRPYGSMEPPYRPLQTLGAEEKQLLRTFSGRLSHDEHNQVLHSLALIDNRVFFGEIHQESAKNIFRTVDKLLRPGVAQYEVHAPLLGKQLLMQVANPRLVQQGNHPTCTLASLEHRMYVLHPEHAVRLVADAAISASYKPQFSVQTETAPIVTLNRNILSPTPANRDPFLLTHKGLRRSYASEIFQYVTPNIHWQAQPGQLRYDYDEKTKLYSVFDYTDNAKNPQKLHNYPHLGAHEAHSIYEAITGSAYGFHHDGNSFRTVDEFRTKINEASRSNKLPLVVSIDARQQPFFDMLPEQTRKTLDKGHVHDICITDYNPKTNVVSVYNSWGRQYHPNGIDLGYLFKALDRSQVK